MRFTIGWEGIDFAKCFAACPPRHDAIKTPDLATHVRLVESVVPLSLSFCSSNLQGNYTVRTAVRPRIRSTEVSLPFLCLSLLTSPFLRRHQLDPVAVVAVGGIARGQRDARRISRSNNSQLRLVPCCGILFHCSNFSITPRSLISFSWSSVHPSPPSRSCPSLQPSFDLNIHFHRDGDGGWIASAVHPLPRARSLARRVRP